MLDKISCYFLALSAILYIFFQTINNKILYDSSFLSFQRLNSFKILWFFHETWLFFVLAQLWLLPSFYAVFFQEKELWIFLFSINLIIRGFVWEQGNHRLKLFTIINFIILEYCLVVKHYNLPNFLSFLFINLSCLFIPFNRKIWLVDLFGKLFLVLLWVIWQIRLDNLVINLQQIMTGHCAQSLNLFWTVFSLIFPILLIQYLHLWRLILKKIK